MVRVLKNRALKFKKSFSFIALHFVIVFTTLQELQLSLKIIFPGVGPAIQR
jgi:hypothetical protein